MRITKKIISLLLVVSMLASFLAMTGFEASAALTGQQKTDFGLHFDDTTRKFKVLQLSDIQTDHGDSNISAETKTAIRLAIDRYDPDLILLSGDQVQGGSSLLATLAQWKSSINAVFNTFTPYMKSTCKVIAVPGNHEYDYGNLKDQWEYYNAQSWYLDWDNNFSTVDLNGEPGAGNVTVSAGSGNNAVALNIALFNSKGDDEDGYLRPGGDDEAAYQEICNWYTNMNNTLASSAYSYKAQVTGQSSAYVPAFGMQHVILQEIYGCLEACGSTEGVAAATDGDYGSLLDANYMRFKSGLSYTGVLGEAPCPSTLAAGSTSTLYHALLDPGNFLGMTFGHDHLNTFDITDANGFRFLMGGALTSENYNNGDPNVRYMEFTLDDATGEVELKSETKSYFQMTVSAETTVDEDRIEAINGENNQILHTISAPKTIYVGHQENNNDPRAVQKVGTVVQEKLLDYETKSYYEQDLEVRFCIPEDAVIEGYGAFQGSTQLTLVQTGTTTTTEGTVYTYKISTANNLSADQSNNANTVIYTCTYTYDGERYEIYNTSKVENIKMPAGYADWYRSWRVKNNNTDYYLDLHYVGTLSGSNAYSIGRDVTTNQGDPRYVSNIHFDYSKPGTDPDAAWVNHNGDGFYSMYFWSPSREEATAGLLAKRNVYNPPRTDIYLDTSVLKQISATDPRLDTGVRIDFWMPMNNGRGFSAYAAGIGFYAGDQDYVWNGTTIDPGDAYATYQAAIEAENNSISVGTADNPTVFTYNSYAGQQSYAGLGTTHVNSNQNEANLIGNVAGDSVGYPLVVDSVSAATALNGVDMTMFTGVRVKGATVDGYRQLSVAIAPYYLCFHSFDKSELRSLVMGELMNPRVRSDYPNADDTTWTAYIEAYKLALASYAKVNTDQDSVDGSYESLDAAIIALLNSNKQADESLVLRSDYGLTSLSVPPILYVSGSTIQTASPYTDLEIKFTVPENATNIKVTVINNNSAESTNTAVTLKDNNSSATGSSITVTPNGTTASVKVNGGTASAGGAVYYKITFEMPQDSNKDGKNDEYQQYAASYVKATMYYQGQWVMRIVRETGHVINSRQSCMSVFYNSIIDSSQAYGVRGASSAVALYPVQARDSFNESVISPTSTNLNQANMGYEGAVGWAIGTGMGQDYNGNSSPTYSHANRVTYYNDRSRQNGEYWIGLSNVGGESNEYIVAHFYYNKQAVGSATKLQTKITHEHAGYTSDTDSAGNVTTDHYGRQLWSPKTIGTTYSGWPGKSTGQADIVTDSGNVLEYVSGSTLDNLLTSGNSLTGTIQNYFDLTSVATATDTDRGYKEGAGYHQRWRQSSGTDKPYLSVSTGVGIVYNAVDRATAAEYIGYSLNNGLTGFNKADMDPAWWDEWRTELLEAYVCYGNLWGSDFDGSRMLELFYAETYREADYSDLVAAVNEAATELDGSTLLTLGSDESIQDYEKLLFKVNSADDSRYVGDLYAADMFVNNAADLIKVIEGRITAVYSADADETVNGTGNAHAAHLDFRYQPIIDEYTKQIREAYALLYLANADYTAFDKFTNYYNSTNDTILFMRDDYAGYNNDKDSRDYANEKNLASAMFTAATRKAFIDSLDIDRTLKKPSEQKAIDSMPQIYPNNYKFTFKNQTNPNTDVCLYNTARDAYEALEFRRAGEYYSADGTYTEGGVTYYANYNKQDRGSSYYYTPVFTASYNSLTANITNGGYAVTDAKVGPTYTAGNAATVPVTDGAGNAVSYLSKWTAASWGGDGENYGFADAYTTNISNSDSTYQTTNSSSTWVLALYVESHICPELANVDYYYDKLKANTVDLTQLNIQKNSYAEYEKGGSGYDALAGFEILDENGNVLTDGAQWYTADTWDEYIAVKKADGTSVPDGSNLDEAQGIINMITQEIYNRRNALQLRPMEDYRVADSVLDAVTSEENILDMSQYDAAQPEKELPVIVPSGTSYPAANNFTAINNIITYYNAVIGNKYVGVFGSRYTVPQDRTVVEGNALLFKKHYFYKEQFRTNLAARYSAIDGYAGKPMATNIQNYVTAVNAFKALFDQKDQNLNAADYSTVTMLLNKAWIPTYDTYGTGNYNDGSYILGSQYTGADWYTPETWTEYFNARETAAKLYESNNGYDGYLGYTQAYGNGEAVGDLLVDSQGSNATNVEGSINKAAYDLLVAYYKLQHKKVSDFDGTIAGLTGTYTSINEQLDAMLLAKEQEKVDVVIVNAAGELETVKKSVYDPVQIALARDFKDKIVALENENLGPMYSEYLAAVNNYKTTIENLPKAPVYLDGWNGIINHLNENAGDIHTIYSSDDLTLYFNAVYGEEFKPAIKYAGEDSVSIKDIFSNKNMYDGFGLTAQQGQAQYNSLITAFYNELHAASFVPKQVTSAAAAAREKISQGTKAAYDPLQLNGRLPVTVVTKYDPDSVAAVEAKIAETEAQKKNLWDTDPTVTGYNDGAVTVLDGSLADEIWAAAGLQSDEFVLDNTKGHDYGTNPDERYLLVEGGQFLDALNDALAYAKGELYEADGVTVKQFNVVKGDGTVIAAPIFTDESVAELLQAIADGESVDSTTSQDLIDDYVFAILEHTDINNTINLLTAEKGYYGQLMDKAEDEGLKYKPADYTYFLEELGLTFAAESDAAQSLVDQVWVDEDGNGEYELVNSLGSTYFTAETWDAYYKAYNNALAVVRNLTAKDQEAYINNHTTAVYETRNALEWNAIGTTKEWNDLMKLGEKIEGLRGEYAEIYTFTNSTVVVNEDGTSYLTAPVVGTKSVNKYGEAETSEILAAWDAFLADYSENDPYDKFEAMVEVLVDLQDKYDNLEQKPLLADSEFAQGVADLVENFIAGSYDPDTGVYTPDYQAVEDGTEINAAEEAIRAEQHKFIQDKLGQIYNLLGGAAINTPHKEHGTYIDAINAYTMELYEYTTGTSAQYAGFALDMRQHIYDYLSSTITVLVETRESANGTVYTKEVNVFDPNYLAETKNSIENEYFLNEGYWPTISQLDDSVNMDLNEDVNYYTIPTTVIDEDGNEVGGIGVYELLSYIGSYSEFYKSAYGNSNVHAVEHLQWLANQAITEINGKTYVMAQPDGAITIADAEFIYKMDKNNNRDGEWYTVGYGENIDGVVYYPAAGDTVVGSEYGGWFTDDSYSAVLEQIDNSVDANGNSLFEYEIAYGEGANAYAVLEGLTEDDLGVCWNAALREEYLTAVAADQKAIDTAARDIYQKICALKLLPATQAYRDVASHIYDVLGIIPSYNDGDTNVFLTNDVLENQDAYHVDGGLVYNEDLADYIDSEALKPIYNEKNEIIGYRSPLLPDGYVGGEDAVSAILNVLQNMMNDAPKTVDMSADVVDINKDGSEMKVVHNELMKLSLGQADFSKITSLVTAFLRNNPGRTDNLGSYALNSDFFDVTHTVLGKTGNAKDYREDVNGIMHEATQLYHESGFYHFNMYTQESLLAVIEFLNKNDIINYTTYNNVKNFDIESQTGFNIDFVPTIDKGNAGDLYKTLKTKQTLVDQVYEELVVIINALELEPAGTVALKGNIANGDEVTLNKAIYDIEAINPVTQKTYWSEFEDAYDEATRYSDATIINQAQVDAASNKLYTAIKALPLYADSFAPIVTVHNTQSDLNKFYAEHESELKNTISSAAQMVTGSYMEPGLGGYTLYVYTNQLNPQIVVSLKDATVAANGDGTSRTVKTSKPEKMTVSGKAMSGVTANVITPVLDATNGTAISSQLVTLTGATTATAQTAKNAEGTYDADSSAYIILAPEFSDVDGKQQAAMYTIQATDSAVKKDTATDEIVESFNSANQFRYSNDSVLNDNVTNGDITVFVYYMNAMPANGSDNGIEADGTINESAVLTNAEYNGYAADKWTNLFSLHRTFHSSVKSWEFVDTAAKLNAGAVFYDPTFGENNFGSFVYALDPDATSGLDYDIASVYFTSGADAAKSAFISALTSNDEYIAQFASESRNASSTKYMPYGSTDNWHKHLAFIDNGTLLFAHVVDRFGNVCNRLIEVKNYDQLAPVLTADAVGAASVVEPGGSGVANVDLFKYMGTQGGSLYIGEIYEKLHIDGVSYVSEDNTFKISTGEPNKLFTVAVTDNAGNVGSVPVYSDAEGYIVVTVTETYDNVAKYKANPNDISLDSGEDTGVTEFIFNTNSVVILNYGSLSSIVKAGPDGSVFAELPEEPISIITKAEVESIKLYDLDTGAEEIWTKDSVTVKDNGDGNIKWIGEYTFEEREYNYKATAMVNGEWEDYSVDFSFNATTKKVILKILTSGIGKVTLTYNGENRTKLSTMSAKEVPYGSVVQLAAASTNAASEFYYWQNDYSDRIMTAASTMEFTAVTNMELTAQFTTTQVFVNDKKLVVYVNNADNVVEAFELAEGESYTVPKAPTLPDYVFKSWSMTQEEVLASEEQMIIVRPVYSVVAKNTVALTEGNWTTTGAGVYESVDDKRALVSISASAKNDDGADFLYWLDAETGDIASYNRTYTFHVIKDTELTPVYGDASAVVPVPVARISTMKYDNTAKKVSFFAERSVPAGYAINSTGIVVTKTASIGTDEAAFILDAAGVSKGISNKKTSNGYYTASVSAPAGTVVYARAFIVCTNADGEIVTLYSPIVSYNA